MKYYSFDDEKIQQALDSAKNHFEALGAAPQDLGNTHVSCVSLAGGCISVTVENNKVCVDLPLGLGKHCLPIPLSVPNGTAAQACLNICTTWGIPTGVSVSVKVAGVTVVSQSFGKC